ncbi:MAG: hypothetical protein IT520_07535, partial [Burkholderiales bacterium]|nr:hypothetical protein [Burkholderiales bacterium]
MLRRCQQGLLSALSAALLLAPGCVTGGGGGGGQGVIAVGSVLIYSQIAKDSKDGNAGARSLWCGTLTRVRDQLAAWQGQGHSEDDLVTELTPAVGQLARENGYAMHMTQVRMLILDAAHVEADKSVVEQELK